MIQFMRCAGIVACLLPMGCGWLELREQDSSHPAEAQRPPARAQKPPEEDPFERPEPGMSPSPEATENDSIPRLPQPPLHAPMDYSAGGMPVMESPEIVWGAVPSSEACPCPKCRKARQRWWHRFSPCRDEDCDGHPQVPCEHLVEAHERAMERVPPVGTFLYAAMDTQIANGDAADMMIYDYDFLPGTAVLKVRGQREVRKLHQAFLMTAAPLLIQTTPGHPQLDHTRRASVLAELERNGTPMPPESVLISEPLTRGLDGVDAEVVHGRLLQQQAGGAPGAGVPATPEPTIGFPGGP